MMEPAHPRRRAILAAAVAIGIAAVMLPIGRGACAKEFKTGSIAVEQPWARATPGGASVGAGYLTITNGADTPDRLVSVSADVAGRTEMHQMDMADGVMRMRPLPEGVEVPAHGAVALAPGATHLMLLDLKQPLKEGDRFAGTLTFEKAGSLDVTFEVRGLGAKATTGEHDHQ
jgi:periplasmic copper chaperone A